MKKNFDYKGFFNFTFNNKNMKIHKNKIQNAKH